MLSRLLIGLEAILYGAIALGTNISIKVFWWGLIVTGMVYIVEGYYGPVMAKIRPAA